MKRKRLHSLLIMAFFSVFTASTILLGFRGAPFLELLPLSAGAWTTYLTAHYLLTGSLTDGVSGDRKERGYTSLAAGVMAMVAAFPVGAHAVRVFSFPVMLFSQSLFVYGYMLAHHSVTGKLL